MFTFIPVTLFSANRERHKTLGTPRSSRAQLASTVRLPQGEKIFSQNELTDSLMHSWHFEQLVDCRSVVLKCSLIYVSKSTSTQLEMPSRVRIPTFINICRVYRFRSQFGKWSLGSPSSEPRYSLYVLCVQKQSFNRFTICMLVCADPQRILGNTSRTRIFTGVVKLVSGNPESLFFSVLQSTAIFSERASSSNAWTHLAGGVD